MGKEQEAPVIGLELVDPASDHSAVEVSFREVLPAVALGQLVAVDQESGPLVDFPFNHSGKMLRARTLIPLDKRHKGREVALVFEDGEVTRPVIVGVVQDWNAPTSDRLEEVEKVGAVAVKHDDDSLLLTADREITFQCGKASITLTSAGKVLLRGTYVLSRSSGVNRIKGGSVQIN